MDEVMLQEIDPFELQMLEHNGLIVILGIIALLVTVVYSFKKGGVRETIENSFLWFLLFYGTMLIASYPVKSDDEITGAICFLAFGVCRIAKHLAYKKTEL